MSVSANQTCIIIGASHGGVNAAFSLRKSGWLGNIILIDSDAALPYHRPPLSKGYLTDTSNIQPPLLKPASNYEKLNINLLLGKTVVKINRELKLITLKNGDSLGYDKLVFAIGASAITPPITGLKAASNLFTLRTQSDVDHIRRAFNQSINKRVVIIGGGYIGLETAASLNKLGGNITLLEREPRLLARVTSPEMSTYFEQLHLSHGVKIKTNQNVEAIKNNGVSQQIFCQNGEFYDADIIIIGVGVKVNTDLAAQSDIAINNGVVVNNQCQTNDENIYAIGDCSFHYNEHYDCWLRLESVQNAVDQAKVAAEHICEKNTSYQAIPWFWSDQYDTKLQMVGLSKGYNNIIRRIELDEENKFSVWYFNDDQLLAVDAVNHAKAYVLGTKLLKTKATLNKKSLANSETILSWDTLNADKLD